MSPDFRRRRLVAALAAGGTLATVPGARAQAPATKPAPLFEGMGGYRLAGASEVPQAQRYADQGMVLAFGFNPAEAARSFAAATVLDPDAAACWWGLAWALGPTINADTAPEDVPRVEQAVARAVEHAKRATPRMRDVIAALAVRHPRGRPIDEAGYAERMRALAKRYPDDADVLFLAGESILNLHPYDWWERDGRAKPWTPEIESLFGEALARDPAHPGANHYVVHLYESSRTPEKGVPSADRLVDLVPGSGHLLHMPAHVYMRTGRLAEASAANRRSIEADVRYLAQVDAQGAYRVGYVAHNHHFLWASAAMQGRSKEAIEAAGAAWPAACGPQPGDRSTAILQHYYALPLYARVRFGKWDELLTDTLPPDVAEPYPMAVWHYARGTALVRKGRMADARAALERLDRIAADPALEGRAHQEHQCGRRARAHRRADAARRSRVVESPARAREPAPRAGGGARGRTHLRRAAPVARADAARAGCCAARRRTRARRRARLPRGPRALSRERLVAHRARARAAHAGAQRGGEGRRHARPRSVARRRRADHRVALLGSILRGSKGQEPRSPTEAGRRACMRALPPLQTRRHDVRRIWLVAHAAAFRLLRTSKLSIR